MTLDLDLLKGQRAKFVIMEQIGFKMQQLSRSSTVLQVFFNEISSKLASLL